MNWKTGGGRGQSKNVEMTVNMIFYSKEFLLYRVFHRLSSFSLSPFLSENWSYVVVVFLEMY
jgi:hypothetical protein